MRFLPAYVSTEFLLTLLAALGLLLVHAWKTHGGLFATIWLALTGALGALTANSIGFFATDPRHSWSYDPISLEALLFFSASFYLAALFAKGYVERTRFAGSPVVFAIGSALAWVPFGWGWEGSTLTARGFAQERFGGCGNLEAYLTNERCLGLVPTDGFVVAFATALLLFALSYRLVSLKTQNNARKLLVLAPLTPLLALGAGWLGCRLAS